jgi:dihydropyrimidinase
MTLLIRGGTIVNHDHSARADVLVADGRIVQVAANLAPPAGADIVDAGGAYVMPGGIDPHTHLEFPFMGTVSVDDFEWGTRAALAGGTTMVVDFCIPGAGQSMTAAYQDWRHKSERAVCDYGFHMAVVDWTEQIHADMAAVVGTYGINTFKHFMAYKGALMVDDDQMYASFRRCAELGAMPLVHAENGDVVARLQEKYLAEGVTGPEGHAYSRPPAVEGEATNRAIMLADMAGVPLYVVHVSCRDSAEAIARARAAGKRVYGEPLIQHLVLDESEYRNRDWLHAARRVMSPPFRDKANQAALWVGLQSGALQVVATDHCAFSDAQKKMGIGDFTKIPNGTGGLEDRMKVLWTFGVATGRLTPEEFVAATSTNIARILNIFPKKGAIMPGADADIVIFDAAASSTITAKKQTSRTEYNVFEGVACSGAARTTISRGAIAWSDGDFRAKPGDGDYVPRPAFPAVAVADAKWRASTAPRAVERREVVP